METGELRYSSLLIYDTMKLLRKHNSFIRNVLLCSITTTARVQMPLKILEKEVIVKKRRNNRKKGDLTVSKTIATSKTRACNNTTVSHRTLSHRNHELRNKEVCTQLSGRSYLRDFVLEPNDSVKDI